MKYYYQELTIIPSDEMSSNFILSKVFFKLHVAFGQYKEQNGSNPFGISFPGYIQPGQGCQTLGLKLRVFGPSIECLNKLNISRNLRSWTDYVHIKSPSVVTAEIKGYSSYKRVHTENYSLGNQVARYAKRNGLSFDEALENFIDSPQRKPMALPYVVIPSSSTFAQSSKFSLFIQKEEKGYPVFDDYSTYGLSSTATVPEF